MKSKEYQNGFNSGSYKDNPHNMGTSENNDFERGVTQKQKQASSSVSATSKFNASFLLYNSSTPPEKNTPKSEVPVKLSYTYDKNKLL
jgi:hypothetical protein